MIIPSYLVMLWLSVNCGATAAQSAAVFDFRIDRYKPGRRNPRRSEQERLARLSHQLRQLLRDSGRFSLVDITTPKPHNARTR
jgi:hypothetical protein